MTNPVGSGESVAAPHVEVSIVVPVYRSAGTLGELFRRLSAVMDATGLSYELVFVEDGSPDDSWAILMALRDGSPARVTAIRLMRNYGQHNAVMCGFRHCRGRLIVTIDDDLQNPPEEIPRLLESLRTGGHDLVYGVPRAKRHRAWQNAGSEVIQAFYRHVFRTKARISSFRAIRRELVESIFPYALNFTFIDGLLAWNTQRVGQVEVEHHPRREGRSGYSLRRLLVHAVNIFTNFSLLPLQLVTIGGFVSALCGFAAGIYYLVLYFVKGNFMPGFASIVIAVLVLGGAQLLALGIIGEYLGRLHLNVNRKPQYCVRQVVSTDG